MISEKDQLKKQVAELDETKRKLEDALDDLGKRTAEISILYEITSRGILPFEQFIARLAEMVYASTVEILLPDNQKKLTTLASWGFPAPEILPEATLTISLLHRGKKIGELKLSRFIKKEFREDEKRILTIAAEKIASAIEEEKAGAEREKLAESLKRKTAALERSRRAILHMLKDLKDDLVKLRAVDRMKTEFLSMVSHELRTPLTPIKGFTELLLNGKMGGLDILQVKALQEIHRQGEHLGKLITSILDVAHLEFGKTFTLEKEPLAVKALINDITENFLPLLADKKINLKLAVPDNFPTLLADEAKLTRVVSQLIDNAVKFTPPGGEITVSAAQENNYLEVRVVDTGIGIARENLEKIFDKFYQVDGSYTRRVGGLGIGLTVVREIVKAHGGKLWAESRGLGHGSAFCVSLPERP